jgi:dUTP pyrophosphatase
MPVIFEPLHPDTSVPTRATEGSAGYDVRAYLRVPSVRCSNGVKQWDQAPDDSGEDRVLTLKPGEMALVPLGFRARLPEGIEAQIRPRSGAAFRSGLHIANSPGTVDCDYPGEWLVPVHNASVGDLRICHGDRIAQMVLARYEVIEFEPGSVDVTSGRTAGFGSTGQR